MSSRQNPEHEATANAPRTLSQAGSGTSRPTPAGRPRGGDGAILPDAAPRPTPRSLVTFTVVAACAALAACGVRAGGDSAGAGARAPEALAPGAAGTAEEWNDINDPLRLGREFEYRFEKLPLNGSVDRKPWADSYWPSQQGGLSNRWYGEIDLAPDTVYTRSTIANLTRDELARLSPAEKYDIYKGRFDYPLFRSERQRTSPSDLSWEGLCHGWATVSYLLREPRSVTLKGEGGVEVPFGASDVKALLAYVQGVSGPGKSRGLAARCNVDLDANPDARNRPECRDVNAGSLHVVLANRIGLLKKIFVADTTRSDEVWNYPVHAFESRVVGERSPSANAAPSAVRELSIETRMTYTTGAAPAWNRITSSAATNTTSSYRYWIELDSQGHVVGGSWITANRPDFLWAQNRPVFEGYFADVETIYEASVRSR